MLVVLGGGGGGVGLGGGGGVGRGGGGGGRGRAGERVGEKTDNSLVQGIRKKTKPNQTIIRVFPEFIW